MGNNRNFKNELQSFYPESTCLTPDDGGTLFMVLVRLESGKTLLHATGISEKEAWKAAYQAVYDVWSRFGPSITDYIRRLNPSLTGN
ncbi:hypothetical protein KKI24_24330 [bacterium]|nr:hypothetical protein [bacterium]